MKKPSIKTICRMVTFCCLLVVNSNSYASLIFQFDNAEVAEVDFVGIEVSDLYLSFGPDTLDIGDAFDLLVGSTYGSSDLAYAAGFSFNIDGIEGFGLGNIVSFTPQTEQFFITFVRQAGSFNVSGVTAHFNNNGQGANFYGVAQRPENSVDVSEPASLLLLLLALGFFWSAVIVNTYHNA